MFERPRRSCLNQMTPLFLPVMKGVDVEGEQEVTSRP